MGCDMVVAVGSATVNGHTLFGTNRHGPAGAGMALRLVSGRAFALGETVQTQALQLPQARQTFTVLGSQPLNSWGYDHGINEHELVAACAGWQSKLAGDQPGLTGPDLVRLVLERCRSARQGFDLLTGLVSRHGQSAMGGGPAAVGRLPAADCCATDCQSVPRMQPAAGNDNIFLLADPAEAYVVETAGSAWASLQCGSVRAVNDVGLIRQDWQRLSPGLAEQAIAQGWWPDDGSKLDFSAGLSVKAGDEESALRRWGRATLLLEEQNGHIETSVFRRLLADHYDGTASEVDPLAANGPSPWCRHAGIAQPTATNASFIAELGRTPEHVALAWCAFGPPCLSVYLPIFLQGELPANLGQGDAFASKNLCRRFQQAQNALRGNAERCNRFRKSLTMLQARLDQQAEEFCTEAAALKHTGDAAALSRQAGLFMQNQLEQLEAELQRLAFVSRTHSETVAVGR